MSEREQPHVGCFGRACDCIQHRIVHLQDENERLRRGDLADLARELQVIAEEGFLPDGDHVVTTSVTLWAEGWLVTLAQIGIQPSSLPNISTGEEGSENA